MRCASQTTWPSRPDAIPVSAPSGSSHRHSAATTSSPRSPRPTPSPRCSTARRAGCSSASCPTSGPSSASTRPGRSVPVSRVPTRWVRSSAWWSTAGSPGCWRSARSSGGRVRPRSSWSWASRARSSASPHPRLGHASSRRSGSCGTPSRRRRSCALATDAAEADVVRIAAMAAIGQRAPDERVVDLLEAAAVGDDLIGDVARLALVDLAAIARAGARPCGGAHHRPALPACGHRPAAECGRLGRQRRHRHAPRATGGRARARRHDRRATSDHPVARVGARGHGRPPRASATRSTGTSTAASRCSATPCRPRPRGRCAW